MTKKYYYDCPIKAAYMNHEFGVITYIELSINDKVYDKCLIKDWNNRELELDEKNKYYVAAGSEHIFFQPKEGDIGICEKLLIPIKFNRKDWVHFPTTPRVIKKETYFEIKETLFVKTIYRDGKLFFNPKEEN